MLNETSRKTAVYRQGARDKYNNIIIKNRAPIPYADVAKLRVLWRAAKDNVDKRECVAESVADEV